LSALALFDDPNFDPWPLLTDPFIDPLRQVESLVQPPAAARLYGWRRRIIYPVRGLTVKGILPRGGSKKLRNPHLWRSCLVIRQGREAPKVLYGRTRAHTSPPLPLGEGWVEGISAAWTCLTAPSPPLSRRERASARIRLRQQVTHTRRWIDGGCPHV
jgi:hypothetical protein